MGELRPRHALPSAGIVADALRLARLADAIVGGGGGALQIIIDYDRTITSARNADGSATTTSYGVVEMCLDAAARARTEALNQKYLPIEFDSSLSRSQKSPLMVEWWESAHRVFVDAGVTESAVADAVARAHVTLRPGVRDLFALCAAHEIPVLVFSAGMGNIVRAVLFRELEGGVAQWVTRAIVANWMLWGVDGSLAGFSDPIVHVYSKNSGCVEPALRAELAGRRNAILLGDSTGDASMADGLPHDAVLKVGLLNSDAPDARAAAAYAAAFDAVLLGDAALHDVVALVAAAVARPPAASVEAAATAAGVDSA